MHYSAERLGRSLGHLVAGKTITAVSSIVLLVVLARVLPKADYAVYATLQAVVLLTGAFTSFGINQSLMRYAPELKAAGENAALYRLIRDSIASRLPVIGGGFALFGAALPLLEQPLGLANHRGGVWVYMVVGLLRLLGFMLSRVMEALLWQRLSQYSLAGAAAFRLAAMTALAGSGQLSFAAVVSVELTAEAGCLAALVVGLLRRIARDPDRNAGSGDWASAHRRRMNRFGRWTYLSSLCAQMGTSSPYRLLSASLLATDATALMGFVFSAIDLLYRFMPAQLAQTVVRSVLVARRTLGHQTAQLIGALNLNFRVNAVLLGFFALGSTAVGDRVGAVLTAGKYRGTGLLLAAMATVLILDALRAQFETLAQVIERADWTFWGNAGLATGLLAALALTPRVGLWALPASALLGQLASLAVYVVGLRSHGGSDLAKGRIAAFVVVLCGCAAVIRWALHGTDWWWSALAALASFALSCALVQPLRRAELARLRPGGEIGRGHRTAGA